MNKEYLPEVYRNAHHRARLNILLSASFLTEYIRNFMEQYDITGQQYNILRIVERSGGDLLSILQIREQMFEKMSDTSRLVDRLIAKGLLKKETSTTDKRLVEIYLTDKGKKLLAKIMKNIEEIDLPLKGLSDEEADTVSDLLMKMRHNGNNNK